MVKGPQESQLDPAREISLLADHLIGIMDRIEKDHPYVQEAPYNVAWMAFKEAFQLEYSEPSENTDCLEAIYNDLKAFLKAVAAEREGVRTLRKPRPLNTEEYLKGTFEYLAMALQTQVYREMESDRTRLLAEGLVMGAASFSLFSIEPARCRNEVRDVIFELLADHNSKTDNVRETMDRFGKAKVLLMIAKDDESLKGLIEGVDEIRESLQSQVAKIILHARDGIDEDNGKRISTPRVESPTGEDPGLQKIMAAAARLKARKGRHLTLVASE